MLAFFSRIIIVQHVRVALTNFSGNKLFKNVSYLYQTTKDRPNIEAIHIKARGMFSMQVGKSYDPNLFICYKILLEY